MHRLRDRKIHVSDLPLYDLDDWKEWEGKWELIEGIPYAMSPMPSKKHQRINGKIYRLFSEGLENCPDCEAFLPVNFKVSEHSLLHPDLLVVCGEDEDEMYVTQIPHLVVEILSPSTLNKDTQTKPKIYKAIKIKYYITIDPKEELVSIFGLTEGEYKLLEQGRDVDFDFDFGVCNSKINFQDIWVK